MSNVTNSKPNKRNGIVICGSYGQGNAGDESISRKRFYRKFIKLPPRKTSPFYLAIREETAVRHGVHALHMFDIAGSKK